MHQNDSMKCLNLQSLKVETDVIDKNTQFWSNSYETWWKLPTHELVIMPEY